MYIGAEPDEPHGAFVPIETGCQELADDVLLAQHADVGGGVDTPDSMMRTGSRPGIGRQFVGLVATAHPLGGCARPRRRGAGPPRAARATPRHFDGQENLTLAGTVTARDGGWVFLPERALADFDLGYVRPARR